jgi:hypothetical protein
MRRNAIALLALGYLITALMVVGNGGEKKAEKNSRPRITIGKDTTYLTKPRDADGYVDYTAALNERLRQGVTPDNNANVLLWQAFGPIPRGEKVRAEFFAAMGMTAPPEQGDYLIALYPFLKKHYKNDPAKDEAFLSAETDRVAERPWTAKQYPHIAA